MSPLTLQHTSSNSLLLQDLFGSTPGAVFTSVKQSCMGTSFKEHLLVAAKARPASVAGVQLGGACSDDTVQSHSVQVRPVNNQLCFASKASISCVRENTGCMLVHSTEGTASAGSLAVPVMWLLRRGDIRAAAWCCRTASCICAELRAILGQRCSPGGEGGYSSCVLPHAR